MFSMLVFKMASSKARLPVRKPLRPTMFLVWKTL
jgi:hypothetical protein